MTERENPKRSFALSSVRILFGIRGLILEPSSICFELEIHPSNATQIRMSEGENPKRFDLEERTYEFAKRARAFVKRLAKTIGNIEDARQLVRSSGSVGANYIEANEALSKKDFILRIKICRKEAKETRYWLRLVEAAEESLAAERSLLVQEAQELMNIFGAIVRKSEK
jgi:four helix bundle protein